MAAVPSEAEVRVMPIVKLRGIIDELGLPVKKNVGNAGRTKEDVLNEVLEALVPLRQSQQKVAAVPGSASAVTAADDTVAPQSAEDRSIEVPYCSDNDLDACSLQRLKDIIDAEGLQVSKMVGGNAGRKMSDIVLDIKEARALGPAARGCSAASSSRARAATSRRPLAPSGPLPWQVSGGSVGTMHVGNFVVSKLMLSQPEDAEKECCFLSLLFEGRSQGTEMKLPSASSGSEAAEKAFQADGRTYELVASKVVEDDHAWHGMKQKNVRCLYVATSGPGLDNIDVARELEKVADFSALPSIRKVASRLELMLSTTKRQNFLNLRADSFEMLQAEPMSLEGDPMSDGCGFIPYDLLQQCFGKAAQLGVQVRIFAPTLGVFKGVLCAKKGIDKIQLFPSMRKVPPSQTCSDDWVALLVLRVYPSAGSLKMGKRLAGDKPPKLPEAKPLSPMIQVLWKTLGVPADLLDKLKKKARDEKAEHAFVVGVGDPTDSIPEKHIFVTGLPVSTVFVTRTPCVKATDGQLLRCIVTRPEGMSEEIWEWLRSLPFGSLIFSTKGAAPMPASLAEGDLDGDLYFVCWDAALLASVRPRGASECKAAEEAERSEVDALAEAEKKAEQQHEEAKPPAWRDGQWFPRAQAHMIDGKVLRERNDIGKIYKAWEKMVDGSPEGMDNFDAKQLAAAYVQALDRGKHGGSIDLPEHLRKLVNLK